jgi:hypothetical protein
MELFTTTPKSPKPQQILARISPPPINEFKKKKKVNKRKEKHTYIIAS